MANMQRQLARAKYLTRFPGDCFLVGLPLWFEFVDDHIVAPSHDLTDANGFKWIKFSSYDQLVGVLHAFWDDYGPELPELRVRVMPYAPLSDAYRLHQLVIHPDVLPNPYADVVANHVMGDMGEAHIHAIDQEEEEEEEDLAAAEMREAVLPLHPLHVNVHFTIANYGFLWAKAERFCASTFICDAFSDVLARLTLCNQHLPQPSPALLATLEANLLRSKRELVFSMYLHKTNTHDVIQLLFPDMHAEIYHNCVHCNPNVDDDEKVDSEETMDRLHTALTEAGLEDYDADLSVDSARVQLMSYEGMLESYMSDLNAVQRFNAASSHLRQVLLPLLNSFHVGRNEPSVMGVPFLQAGDL